LVDGHAYWADPQKDFSSWKSITMPNNWEAAGLPNVDGIVWLETSFELKKEDIKGPAVLNLGPIDDSDITWINGKKAGEITGNYKEPRVYDLDLSILHPGKNILVVRVEDTGGLGGFGGKDLHITLGNKEIPLAGEWRYKVG